MALYKNEYLRNPCPNDIFISFIYSTRNISSCNIKRGNAILEVDRYIDCKNMGEF